MKIPSSILLSAGALILYFSFVQIYLWLKIEGKRQPFRYNLLSKKWIKNLLKKPYFQFLLQLPFALVFIFIIYAGLSGHYIINIAPILTWTIWWSGLIFLVFVAGKAWCFICPWYFIAGCFVKLKFFGISEKPLTLGWKWPEKLKNIYPAILLFLLLTWFELGFNITSSPRLTAYFAIAILLLSAVPALLFEKKPYCRHACLVGRISGLYALFAPVEVRRREAVICAQCRTRDCFSGNSKGMPCPTSLCLANLEENTYCIMCSECIKSCPHDNAAVNIRPFGADLTDGFKGRNDEAYLAIVMLSMTYFHGITMTGAWRNDGEGWSVISLFEGIFNNNYILNFSLGMFLMILLPAVIYGVAVFTSVKLSGKDFREFRGDSIKYAYALLPVALFYHLSHNIAHLLNEGQNIFTLLSDPLGRGDNYFNTAAIVFPPIAPMHIVWLLQLLLITTGQYWGIKIALSISEKNAGLKGESLRNIIPVLAVITFFSFISLALMGIDMAMRSRM